MAFSSNTQAYSINIKQESISTNKIPNILQIGADQYTKPASYSQLVSWYESLVNQYPDYLEIFKANEIYNTGTVEGAYDLYYIRITNEALGFHKPEVLFLGGPHGDETVGTICLYWFTDWLMRMTFTDEKCQDYSKEWLRWLIDNREIYFEVSHNPWGFDEKVRYDANSWDLNREADYDGPGGYNDEEIWGSVNGKTLRAFVDDHLIRVGCDFHEGVRAMLYPWSSNHDSISATSKVSGKQYTHVPPDFHYFDASAMRVGSYMGQCVDPRYGGAFNEYNTGPIPDAIGYEANGGIAPWAYGADVVKNPNEDEYVNDEIFGNYPGSGILWYSPEMCDAKNPPQNQFGGDTTDGFGTEVRRFVLHQTDLAQPYIHIVKAPDERFFMQPNKEFNIEWQVNGCVVVDSTYIQWGDDPDPINNPQFFTQDNNQYAGNYEGGTGWDNAEDGETNAVTYTETFSFDTPCDHYFVIKAKVDQVYANSIHPEEYGINPYLRIIKERTDESYYETLTGADGTEIIQGQLWWYSPIIHVEVTEFSNPPEKPDLNGPTQGQPGIEYNFEATTTETDGDQIYYKWQWGDGSESIWTGPYTSGDTCEKSHIYDERGTYDIKVKAIDINGAESEWADPLSVTMPRNGLSGRPILILIKQILENFPILNRLLGI